jgi:UDP-N-acetylmuramate--alanine ligase
MIHPQDVPSSPEGHSRSGASTRALLAGIPARVHLLGAGGAGVSGAARILVEHGHRVSAADRAASEHTEQLQALGVELLVGRDACGQLPMGVELVARSAAVPESDPAVQAAQARGVPVIKYSELLSRLCPSGRTLAVAGTHGKTTTAWMSYHALAGIARGTQGASGAALPGALVGGICRQIDSNAVAVEPGGWFVVEACEYDRSFLALAPRGAIVTNVEADHLDYYGTFEALESAFAHFADRVHPDGLLVLGKDVPRLIEGSARCEVWRLGREVKVRLLAERTGYFALSLSTPRFALEQVVLGVPGQFNVDNAACALALTVGLWSKAAGIEGSRPAQLAAGGLERYRGARRRFEPWGELEGVRVVHDYAHHPTEVRVTLETARRVYPGVPLAVLFQPHQHSRTARFLEEFAEALRFADAVVVADVYGARAHIDGANLAGARELVEALQARGVDAREGGACGAAAALFARALPRPCAALVLGAGDVVEVKHALLQELALRGAGAGGPGR